MAKAAGGEAQCDDGATADLDVPTNRSADPCQLHTDRVKHALSTTSVAWPGWIWISGAPGDGQLRVCRHSCAGQCSSQAWAQREAVRRSLTVNAVLTRLGRALNPAMGLAGPCPTCPARQPERSAAWAVRPKHPRLTRDTPDRAWMPENMSSMIVKDSNMYIHIYVINKDSNMYITMSRS